ncbi:MAG TPA: phospho-N-acetylmuramoyl-pentapeptide-transferase, partial [Gaiellaceae bacterium]
RAALMFTALAAGITSMVVILIVGPWFIEWLRRNEFGQTIRDEGPQGHKTKEGTPTMGGVLIWLAVLVPFFIFSQLSVASFSVLVVALGCALIGLADDWMKIIKGRSLGLSARWKLLLQLALGLLAGFIALHFAGLTTSVSIPFSHAQWHLGTVGFYGLVFLVIAGASNTVNLTDGLDGLAAGSAAIVLVAYAGIAFIIGRHLPDPGMLDLSVLSTCIVGACLGFLWFNTFPADVFMGDTGSMGIGGALAGFAIMTKTELLLLLIAGVFLIEALSVMIQVFSFRYFKRRVFLMAPIHHHFEMKAWSETKIMVRFWILCGIFCACAFALYYRNYIGFRF